MLWSGVLTKKSEELIKNLDFRVVRSNENDSST
jgi:hypothetical protein